MRRRRGFERGARRNRGGALAGLDGTSERVLKGFGPSEQSGSRQEATRTSCERTASSAGLLGLVRVLDLFIRLLEGHPTRTEHLRTRTTPSSAVRQLDSLAVGHLARDTLDGWTCKAANRVVRGRYTVPFDWAAAGSRDGAGRALTWRLATDATSGAGLAGYGS